MKKLSLLFSLLLSFSSFAQAYEFQTVKEFPHLPVLTQGETGTCWSFSSTSFLESEIMRILGKPIDLSEMYSVRQTYLKKGSNYVMRQGKAQFGEGGLNHDVINSAMEFGLVPNETFSGMVNTTAHNHTAMTEELNGIVKNTVENPTKYISNWKTEYETVLDKYLGKDVVEFTYEGKKYTPKQFVEFTNLNLNDYLTITSFTHEPYYSKFILNIPDNFANGSFYNLPLDEFVSCIDYALDNGFTLAIDADVSEKTFSEKTGIASIPDNENDFPAILSEIKTQKVITPEFRQSEFENYNTTDDHLMHIVGRVKDQKGSIYYKVKNSWGSYSGKDGFMYMSVSYLRLKAISVMLHKAGLPRETKTRLKN